MQDTRCRSSGTCRGRSTPRRWLERTGSALMHQLVVAAVESLRTRLLENAHLEVPLAAPEVDPNIPVAVRVLIDVATFDPDHVARHTARLAQTSSARSSSPSFGAVKAASS
jgi:hypothetical protein